MTQDAYPQPNILTPVPDVHDEVLEIYSANLEAVKDFYEARAKIAQTNADLFKKGYVFNHPVMSW